MTIESAPTHPISTTEPAPTTNCRWIDRAEDLRSACRCWAREPAIGLDTEFVRERTFFPALGLIQVSDAEGNTLIDPLAVVDLAPLKEVLDAPDVLKVFHSCSEDLEVFFHHFGAFPEPLFDTQVAASLASVGHSLGYARLVATLFGDEIPKGQTRTNWLRRPLTEAQVRYAWLDVAYLLPLYFRLSKHLRDQGREAWAEEAFSQLPDAERFLPDPERAYLRLRAHRSLPRPALGHLRSLCAWREREARDRNVPRNFVLKESALIQLARRPTTSMKDLASRGLRRHEIQRYGAKLCRIADQANRLSSAELPAKAQRKEDISSYKKEIDALRSEVRTLGEELGIAPELLATRRALEELVRRTVFDKSPLIPDQLRGWRQEILERRLRPLLKSLAPPVESSRIRKNGSG